MNASGLVSVIIPTYRRAALVPRAINSVCGQRYRKLEILVVDDGSPDDTEAVVNAVRDPRVRYLRHEWNRGLPAARNTGIRAARGEYIAFIDDDDEWRPDKLEKQIATLQHYGAVLCMSVSNGFSMRVHNRSNIALDDLRKGSFNPSSLIVNSTILKELLFDENLRQGEDWDALIRIAERCRIGWIAEPLVVYNESSPGRMTSIEGIAEDDLDKRTAILRKHRKFFGEHWFKYHLADACLAHFGHRQGKLKCIADTIHRCGIHAVLGVVAHRVRRRSRRLMQTGRGKWSSAFRSPARAPGRDEAGSDRAGTRWNLPSVSWAAIARWERKQ